MIISEKQIMKLIRYLRASIQQILTEAGKEHALILLSQIEDQQSEELKVIE